MNNVEGNTLSGILSITLIIMIFILLILISAYIIIKIKQKMNKKEEKKEFSNNIPNKVSDNKKSTIDKSYSKQSIMDFMEFDNVQDNMIIQENGKRFLMVIQCQGVNYDLMSQMEKVAVEEGFQQFLNTLRHPIQLYIQTRSINLESSLKTYNNRLKEIEDKLNSLQYQYNQMKQTNAYTKEQMDKQLFDIKKQKNLYEYAKDIINNTEKMNKSRNVLNKQYYIVIPYIPEETEKFDAEEIQNMAFSELYTNSQAIIRTLSACSVMGKIMNSKELIELLYFAYNRDSAESFGIERALRAGFNELYSTSQDVYEKKIKAIDNMIEERAIELANSKIERAKSIVEENAYLKEQNMDELTMNMAKILIEENERNLGTEIAQTAIEEIEKDAKEEKKNVQEKTTRRKRSRQ
ncbi:MAG: hypothetical protein IJJ82_04915 [Clostridia bacterium]|nr:hypothetical protein [Clostridia bacterium]